MKELKDKKVIVTGGAGFIGSHLVDRLLELGNQVIVIDDFSLGKKENLAHQEYNPNLKIYDKDICDKDILDLFEGVNIVFHVAAVPRVQYSIKYPKKTNRANIYGTLNILEACKKAGVKRFVYSASSSAYGDQDKLPLIETMNPNPMSPYALQKLVGEYYCKLYYLIHGIETISLRYFNVYGPRQDPDGGYACLIPKSINLVLEEKSPVIYGDGEQTRDFTFVKDVVESNILAAVTENKKAFGEVFNIGNGNNLSVNFVVKSIIGDKDIKPIYSDPVIEPRDTLADISKAKKILSWQPKYTFEQGLKETIEWFRIKGFYDKKEAIKKGFKYFRL
jgi:UDP-glucose 4-epimerase